MISKALVLSMYESSLLSSAGIPLVDGWQAITDTYTEPEVISLFTELRKDLLAQAPSFEPFKNNAVLKDDAVVACHFAELAANTTVFDQNWSEMATAYLLKKKLATAAPSEADVRLGTYFVSIGDISPDMSLRAEMQTWSQDPLWQLPQTTTSSEFPEDWWDTFEVNTSTIKFPKTMLVILKGALMSGTLDTQIPQTVARWTRFSEIADKVYG